MSLGVGCRRIVRVDVDLPLVSARSFRLFDAPGLSLVLVGLTLDSLQLTFLSFSS